MGKFAAISGEKIVPLPPPPRSQLLQTQTAPPLLGSTGEEETPQPFSSSASVFQYNNKYKTDPAPVAHINIFTSLSALIICDFSVGCPSVNIKLYRHHYCNHHHCPRLHHPYCHHHHYPELSSSLKVSLITFIYVFLSPSITKLKLLI